MKRENEKGVKLIELIIVVVIIAIIAVLAVPGIGTWMVHYRLPSATNDLVSIMRPAQMKAVSTDVEYRVFSPTRLFCFKGKSKLWLNDLNK